MEREGLVKPGDRVELNEDRASTMSGMMYYYTIKDAIAMSSNLKRPLTKLAGTVRKVEQQVSIYMVTVEIDEELNIKKYSQKEVKLNGRIRPVQIYFEQLHRTISGSEGFTLTWLIRKSGMKN